MYIYWLSVLLAIIRHRTAMIAVFRRAGASRTRSPCTRPARCPRPGALVSGALAAGVDASGAVARIRVGVGSVAAGGGISEGSA